jgi:hypothetical protein
MVADMPAFAGQLKPDWSGVAACALVGLIALIGSIVAVQNRYRAGLLFLISAPITGACFAWWNRRDWLEGGLSLQGFTEIFAWTSLLFVVPGLFWLITSRLNWPPAISFRLVTGSRFRIVLAHGLVFLSFMVLGLLLALYVPVGSAVCDTLPPIVSQQFPDQAVFTARVIARMHAITRFRHLFSSWSLLRVDRRYWGSPSWAGFAIYRVELPKQHGDDYFIDGRRSQGLLMHFLPVIEYNYCSHTMPMSRGVVDLRVLEDGAPKSGVRIIGRVYAERLEEVEDVPGVKVRVTGPNGTISATTDAHGIYDINGLSSGHYSIQLDSDHQAQRYPWNEADLKPGEVWGPFLYANIAIRPAP